MKAGIVIDDWKFDIFESHLTEAGYTFEKINGPAEDALTLTVETTDAAALGAVVRAANTEAVSKFTPGSTALH